MASEPPARVREGAHIDSLAQYKKMYADSIENPDKFWADQARTYLSWFKDFEPIGPEKRVLTGDFQHGDVAWFPRGKLNAAYNCVDRHVEAGRGDKVAILWEGDHAEDLRRITYRELQHEVHRMANALRRRGVRKGDCVCIYMPMVPEAAVAMLACAFIGAPHAVVFGGFSVEALRERIIDGKCKCVITADQGRRANKIINLKRTVDLALLGTSEPGHSVTTVESVIVYKHTGCEEVAKAHFTPGRDHWWHELAAAERPMAVPEEMDSEDVLFLLFTSGSTGRPKGIQHCTAGYLLYAQMTTKLVFDLREDDIYACMADIGWITGHTYTTYGPLLNGATTFIFEGVPTFPDAGRYWDMVQRHRITNFYTSPTALRALMRCGDDYVTAYDRSSLRVLGSVGEPINPEAWRWYYEVVGDKRAAVVDTYWQTETGGHIITALPGAIATKPGSATLPFFGIEPVLLDDKGKEITENNISGFLCVRKPWPGMVRTCWGDHNRFMHTYLTPYPGYYFTGDGAYRDSDGYYWITGRVDDVINVSGHRIGSAEIESSLVSHQAVAEAAVVGVPHVVKGQALFAYVTLKDGYTTSPLLTSELMLTVGQQVGSFARPDYVVLAPSLPKTRSGKIMRRLLRKIACQETESLGDTSTLADPEVVDDLISRVNAMFGGLSVRM